MLLHLQINFSCMNCSHNIRRCNDCLVLLVLVLQAETEGDQEATAGGTSEEAAPDKVRH